MTKNFRVYNTRGFTMKRSAAEKAVRECSAEWVEVGVRIRNLTLQESIDARNLQALMREEQTEYEAWLREPLPHAEIPGLRFEPSVTGLEATRREAFLMWQAHDFAMSWAR